MPNKIKYSTTADSSRALKKGNVLIGTRDLEYGPTSSTGYWNGITPPSAYTVYTLPSNANTPSIVTPADDTQMIAYARTLGGNPSTIGDALSYVAGLNNSIAVNRDYEDIVLDSLVFGWDAGFTASYPRAGSTVYDLVGSSNGTAVSTSYNSSNGGSLASGAGYINMGSQNLQRNWSLEGWFYMVDSTSFGVFGQGTQAQSAGLHIIYSSGSRGMIFGLYSNDNDYMNNYRPSDNVWYHWVFTYNHSTYDKQFYANGVLQTPGSSVETVYSGSGQLNVGAAYGSPLSLYNGRIAISRMYSKVLSGSEISQNFNAQKSRFGY
jgi:hypothetical protein